MNKNLAIVASFVWLAGCSQMSLRSPTAKATLAPTRGNQASGTVTFVQRGSTVVVDAHISGLSPGLHGFHVHEKGDCRAQDASSAGNHFNPSSAPHGGPETAQRHAGDLGNLTADANGVAVYRVAVTGMSLDSGSNSIIGRAVIVHAAPDDLLTQPSGNSGARVACGLISQSADQWF